MKYQYYEDYFKKHNFNARKCQLFALHCLTNVKYSLKNENSLAVIPALENYIEGNLSQEEMRQLARENNDISDVCEGTNKKNDRQYYLDRKKNIGDLHGQAPVLWCATALLRM